MISIVLCSQCGHGITALHVLKTRLEPTMSRVIPFSEVTKHNNKDDIWVVFHDKVYDLTKFFPEHPGGQKVLLRVAGKDGTKDFAAVHPESFLTEYLTPENCLGTCNDAPQARSSGVQHQRAVALPPLSQMLNVFDFESLAPKVLPREAWDYYSSGADDEITLRENHEAFHRIWLRPRVMVDVSNICTKSTILGHATNFPVYITATAMGRLAHPDGEMVLTRAAHNMGIIQMCPTLGSCSLKEMTDARRGDQVQFFQLYVNRDREKTKKLVQQAEQDGCKALCITVDAPALGSREKDMRNKFTSDEPHEQKENEVGRNQGVARAISTFIDPALCWADIPWFRSITKMPIVLKGVQSGSDAIMAVNHGCDGIILSNHGGRQLDSSRSGIELLVEVMDALRSCGYENKIEVWIDGGIRRGTDIFKALALGAKAVGIGRPCLYSLATYGQSGVEKVLSILQNELIMTMKLMGTPKISDISPSMAITRSLEDHGSYPKSYLSSQTYIPLALPAKL